MALEITTLCIACTACENVCPNQAISAADTQYLIDTDLCTECIEAYADPQCASICPVEGAIADELGQPLNPPGSLTGIIALVAA